MRYKFALLNSKFDKKQVKHARALIGLNHYMADPEFPCKWMFTMTDTTTGKVVGALSVGKNSSPTLAESPVGETKDDRANPKRRSSHVYELNRLWVADSVTEHCIESRFIGWCLQELRKINPQIVLVSYADTAQGHRGVIYQASNWLYTGLTPRNKDRVGDQLIERSRKHRYVWFANPEDRALLKWKIEPYPKRGVPRTRLG